MPRRLLVTVVLLSVLVVVFACSSGPTGSVVNFPDPNLEDRIRKEINKQTGAIYKSDLERICNLYVVGLDISDLTGLEHCAKLKFLVVDENQISDLTPLANLTRLDYLSISYNPISDLRPLSNLTNLQFLYATYCNISDISPLKNLTSLIRFRAHNNQISDISALSNLIYLNTIDLGFNQIGNISPLVENDGLGSGHGDTLTLFNNPLSNESVNLHIPQLEQRGVIVLWID